LIEVSAHQPIGNRKSPTIAIEKQYRSFVSIIFFKMQLLNPFLYRTVHHRFFNIPSANTLKFSVSNSVNI
jgi:hypothetical protein